MSSAPLVIVSTLLALVLIPACAPTGPRGDGQDPADMTPAWSLVVHAGAGTISRDTPRDEIAAYRASLEMALDAGATVLHAGGSSLDAVETVLRLLEDDPLFNAGRGAVFDAEGGHQLDASIMDGRTLACGAVAAVGTVRHPITLARLVMTETRHVLLAGEGAERFADTQGIERVDNTWFDTDHRREQWERRRETGAAPAAGDGNGKYGTVGAVALDRAGHLAAGTSTGGLTNKQFGRVGDSPIVGAGTYADDRTCGVSCTGTGEEFIRFGVARSIAARMAYAGEDLSTAAHAVVHGDLAPDDGGIIALDASGRAVWSFNTTGMYRGAIDATGRRMVRIWGDDEEPPRAR